MCFLWTGLLCKHYIILQVKSGTMCSHVQGFREKKTLHISTYPGKYTHCWLLYVPIFYNSDLNLDTGIQVHSLFVFIDFQFTVLCLLCKMEEVSVNRTFPQRKLIQMLRKKKKCPNVVWFKVQMWKEKELILNRVHYVCWSVKQAIGRLQ